MSRFSTCPVHAVRQHADHQCPTPRAGGSVPQLVLLLHWQLGRPPRREQPLAMHAESTQAGSRPQRANGDATLREQTPFPAAMIQNHGQESLPQHCRAAPQGWLNAHSRAVSGQDTKRVAQCCYFRWICLVAWDPPCVRSLEISCPLLLQSQIAAQLLAVPWTDGSLIALAPG